MKIIDGHALAGMIKKTADQRRDSGLYILAGLATGFVNDMPEAEAYTEKCQRIENMGKIIEDQAERIAIMEAEMPEWIPASERLPEDDGFYLVCGGGLMPWIAECRTFRNVRGWCSNANMPVVKMWMPIPKPPKEGE